VTSEASAVTSDARQRRETRQMRPIACFGEIGLTGELRSVAHPERRLAEAAKFGLVPAIAPIGAGRNATEAPTLRAALKAALGAARSSETRARAA
jgi:DNA repair protein RadA/Sms